MGKPVDEPLFPAALFEYQNRPSRDRFFGVAYVASLVAICVGGVVAFSNRNPAYTRLTSTRHINDPNSCPVNPGRRLLADGPKSHEFELSEFLVMAGIWVLVSFVGSTILGVIFLHMFQHRAGLMVKLTVVIQIAIPVVTGVALCAAGAVIPGAVLLGFAAITGACFYVWRDRMPLVARLISVAAKGLDDNPAIMWIVVLLQAAHSILSIPILFSMIVAYMNGTLAPNPVSAGPHTHSGKQQGCADAQGQQVPCCVWQTEGWVPAYIAFAAAMMTWTTFLSFEIKVYTISGTIAQWYFAPVTATSFRGNATRSLRHAFGPSFGSLALGSGILTICDIIRQAARKNRERSTSIVTVLLECLAACLASIIEFITKFATIRAAISGEAFFGAAHSVVDLLKRNFLNTVGVWWLPPLILRTCCFALSSVMGLSIGALSYGTWTALHRPQAGLSAFLLGLIAFVTCLVILSFFASVLLNTIDAVFVCFAMDRDHQLCTKPAVHEVYSQIPSVGPIVENPDGGVSYGAPASAPPAAGTSMYDAPGYTAPGQGQGPTAPLVSRV